MATILATIPSSSNPEINYNIVLGNDGNTYCTCPGWRFKNQKAGERTCKHLGKYHAAQLGKKTGQTESKATAGRELGQHAAKRTAGTNARLNKKAMVSGTREAAVAAAKAVLAHAGSANTMRLLAYETLAKHEAKPVVEAAPATPALPF